MKCLGCGGKSDVVDSRPAGDLSVWRKRKCRGCGLTWITWEVRDGVDDQAQERMVRLLQAATDCLEKARRELEKKGRPPS